MSALCDLAFRTSGDLLQLSVYEVRLKSTSYLAHTFPLQGSLTWAKRDVDPKKAPAELKDRYHVSLSGFKDVDFRGLVKVSCACESMAAPRPASCSQLTDS
jgi:hypothetical protein